MNLVLLVDDNETNRDLFSRLLARKGWNVLTAEDGVEALAIARQAQPEIILMDLAMPKMGGLEAVRILKAEDRTCLIPIIVLTGYAMQSDQIRSLEAGSDAFEPKPVEFPRLLRKMESLVDEYRRKAPIQQARGA